MESRQFSKPWWGVLLLIIFWPFSLTYWVWKRNWNKKLKLSLIIPIWFIIIVASLARPKEQSNNENTLGQISKSFTFTNLNKAVTAVPTSDSIITPTNIPTTIIIPSITQNSYPSPTLYSNRQQARVIQVVDGDTIKIDGGVKVRYIGINTPETVDFNRPIECYGQESSNKNKELVEGKIVELEKDISETDKYGRLLRYVWSGSILINEYLVREGYAQVSTYPPDVKYQDRFLRAQRLAREERKGLWSGYCDNWNNSSPTKVSTTQSDQTQSNNNQQITTTTSGIYTCDCSKVCNQISSCDEAYYQLGQCGCSKRDGDNDGVPCEDICPGG